jgi:hypothetical protein
MKKDILEYKDKWSAFGDPHAEVKLEETLEPPAPGGSAEEQSGF